jgi:hypothetical protein
MNSQLNSEEYFNMRYEKILNEKIKLLYEKIYTTGILLSNTILEHPNPSNIPKFEHQDFITLRFLDQQSDVILPDVSTHSNQKKSDVNEEEFLKKPNNLVQNGIVVLGNNNVDETATKLQNIIDDMSKDQDELYKMMEERRKNQNSSPKNEPLAPSNSELSAPSNSELSPPVKQESIPKTPIEVKINEQGIPITTLHYHPSLAHIPISAPKEPPTEISPFLAMDSEQRELTYYKLFQEAKKIINSSYSIGSISEEHREKLICEEADKLVELFRKGQIKV